MCSHDRQLDWPCAWPGCPEGLAGAVLVVPVMPRIALWPAAAPTDSVVQNEHYTRTEYLIDGVHYFAWIPEKFNRVLEKSWDFADAERVRLHRIIEDLTKGGG